MRCEVKKTQYIIIFFTILLLLSACTGEQIDNKPIKHFAFTDLDGEKFGTNELYGSIWIADFIFTNCTTVCQPMTAEMASLQELFNKKNINVEFVSFTVDPQFDSPSILKYYALDFTNDFSNWHMLTGYSQDDIEVFAREQFQTIVQKPSTSTQVIHGTNFYLIDQQGVLVSDYNYVDATFIDDMVKDIKNLK